MAPSKFDRYTPYRSLPTYMVSAWTSDALSSYATQSGVRLTATALIPDIANGSPWSTTGPTMRRDWLTKQFGTGSVLRSLSN